MTQNVGTQGSIHQGGQTSSELKSFWVQSQPLPLIPQKMPYFFSIISKNYLTILRKVASYEMNNLGSTLNSGYYVHTTSRAQPSVQWIMGLFPGGRKTAGA
jgi:hypothetical protein